MEYIFGTVRRNGVIAENLKTVGDKHSHLSGFNQTVREFDDSTITDNFHIVEKYRSNKDLSGDCYDWYVIDQHYRYVDKTESLSKSLEEKQADVDAMLVDLEYKLTLVELGVI